jgi:D-3-phosphoglycerate dehydrogenase / 2-oxoglutarate reductase
MPTIVGTSLDAGAGPHIDIFRAAGFEFSEVSRSRDLRNNDQLIAALADTDAVIAGSEPYTAKVIDALPKLRVISRSGVGYDAIDLAACDRAGVVVTITPGVNQESVAEHTLALLFGVARGFPLVDRKVREGNWKRSSGPRVLGSTLGIVGLGRIGQAVATRAIGVGMKVIAYEPQPVHEFVDRCGIELVSLDELLTRSDYVTLHSPLTPETRYLINAATLARMKPTAVLLNTARGGLVDERALVEALRSGRLRGAGLDVFEVEPLPVDNPLLTLDNVLLAGHVAGVDDESRRDTFVMCAETVLDLHAGQWPAERIINLRGVTGWKW